MFWNNFYLELYEYATIYQCKLWPKEEFLSKLNSQHVTNRTFQPSYHIVENETPSLD